MQDVDIRTVPCPNCKQKRLRLKFCFLKGQKQKYAEFKCRFCNATHFAKLPEDINEPVPIALPKREIKK